MKFLAAWKIALCIAFVFIVLPAPAVAQVNAQFTQEQSDRLTPGFARQCHAEISGAMSRAGNNGLPEASKMASLSPFVKSARYNVQSTYEYSLKTIDAPDNEGWRPPITRWFLCASSFILTHWDDSTAVSKASVTASPRRVQPQPTPVVRLGKAARFANPAASKRTVNKFDRPIDHELDEKFGAVSDRYRGASCSGFNTWADCDRASRVNMYELFLQWKKLNDDYKEAEGMAAYEYHAKMFDEAIQINYSSCKAIEDKSMPCDRALPEVSRPPLLSRVIARDGHRALECVRLEQLARSNSSISGGGSVLANYCTDTVTIGWCSTGGECEGGGGNITNLMAGHSWPVEATREVRWGACHGANTLHGDPGSKGLQYTCSAPDTGG